MINLIVIIVTSVEVNSNNGLFKTYKYNPLIYILLSIFCEK